MFGIGGTKAVIGLDVGSYAVKAVALQSNKDRITLQGYAQARIGDQDVGEVIRSVIAQLGLKAGRVVTSVSGRSVIVRQVETPKMPDAELKAHIAYEADKYIPFGSEEVIIDCQPIPARTGMEQLPNQQVMLVAVRKTFIQEHLAQLKSASLMPEAIDVDVFALANAYELLGPAMPPESERKAVALVDIGASKSNIAILQAGRVLFTREIYLAGNEISDAISRTLNETPEDVDALKAAPGEALDALLDAAMPAFEDLANEIRLSFDYVEGQFEAEVATVVLTGGSAQLPHVGEILGNILGRPVSVFDPLSALDLVPSRYDIHGLDANSPGLAVALGLAAHILTHPGTSLGGPQSLAWQPRLPAEAAAASAAIAMDDYAGEAAVAVDQDPEPVEPEPVFAPPAAAFVPPPAPLAPPPVAFAPSSPATVPTVVAPPVEEENGLDALDALAAEEDATGAQQTGSGRVRRSTLLVVLDEDQEAQLASAGSGTTATTIRPGTTRIGIKPEAADDEDGDVGVRLPDLPPPKA